MKILQGKERDILEFINSIKPNDKVGVFTHNDTDGITAALLMNEFLKNRKSKINYLKILSHEKNLWKSILMQSKKTSLTKIFILDLSVDKEQEKDFLKLMENKKVFFIDHHPPTKGMNKIKNIVRSDSQTGVGFLLFRIGTQNKLLDFEKWKLIGIAAGIADYSFKDSQNLRYMKKIYPKIKKDEIFESIPGKMAKQISSSLIYHYKNKIKIYNYLKNEKFRLIKKASSKVEKEIKKHLKRFKIKSQHYKKSNIYHYHLKSKFKISGIISSIVAKEHPNSIIIISGFDGKFTKVSARNFNDNKNVNKALTNLLEDIKDSSCGGHTCASGGRFYKKDYKKFIQNLENYDKNL